MLRVIEDTKLTNIADAIREKNRTEEQMTVDLMPDAIRAIQTASGEKVPKKDVNFYDYDGEILYSYTAAETAELTEMPALPTREGLICQGWNLTLEYVKAYTTDYGKCDIGATYITDDGKTRLYINISNENRMDLPLCLSKVSENNVTIEIDWGDGSQIETVEVIGDTNCIHNYSEMGEYIITLNPSDGCAIGSQEENNSVFGSMEVYLNMLKKVEIGENVTMISPGAFDLCNSLESIVIPEGVTMIGPSAFEKCYSLKSIVIPKGTVIYWNYLFYECKKLENIVFNEVKKSINIAEMKNCNGLISVMIPESVESIGNDSFYGCVGLVSIVIPKGVTSIGGNAFYNCLSMKYYDFSKHTAVPTLVKPYSFENIPSDCEIRVPAALAEEWKEATYWSDYADYIIGV